MSKHFIKPYGIAMASILVVLGLMAWEVRAAPLDVDHEARCYGAAVSAEKYQEARVHRLAVRPYQEAQGQGIAYHTGYAIGFIDGGASLMKMPVPELAKIWYDNNCVEKTE